MTSTRKTVTVQTLIKMLQRLPSDALVYRDNVDMEYGGPGDFWEINAARLLAHFDGRKDWVILGWDDDVA